jgi:hypothetical protein
MTKECRSTATYALELAGSASVIKVVLHDASMEASQVCKLLAYDCSKGKQPGSVVYTWESISRKFSRRFHVELKRWIETVQDE